MNVLSRPSDLDSIFRVEINFSEVVLLDLTTLADILEIANGSIHEIQQVSVQRFILDVKGIPETHCSVAIGGYTDLAGNPGIGASMNVSVPAAIPRRLADMIEYLSSHGLWISSVPFAFLPLVSSG